MKKTKKLLACLIAAATMFTMGSTAFAEDQVHNRFGGFLLPIFIGK